MVSVGLLARLEVQVGRLADLWCYGWGRQLLGCRRPCSGTASTRYRRRDTVLVATYEHHGAHKYRLRLFKAVKDKRPSGDKIW